MSLPPLWTVSRVPEEIWSEIFLHLPRAALPQVNLTQRTFHHIVHPLLFRHLEFHPYNCLAGYSSVNCPPSGLGIPDEEHVIFLLQRLQFWSSSDIAPLVRTCRVSNWSKAAIPPNGWIFRRTDDPYILLNAFFDALPRFTALHHLALTKVHFTQSGLKQLGLLRCLVNFEVLLCSIADGRVVDIGDLTPLHATQVTFRRHDVFSEGCVEHWVPLLNPQILTHLDLAHIPAVLSQIRASTGTFPSVKSLKITMDLCVPSWARILSKFPAIEVLDISRLRFCGYDKVSEPHVPPHGLLTALREYTGPEELLQFLVPIPTLRRVTLPKWCTRTFDDLVQFGVTGTVNNVSSLKVNIVNPATVKFYFEAVCAVCIVFPGLAELHVKIFESPWSRKDWPNNAFKPDKFLTELQERLPLPKSLQKLALHWECPDRTLPADGQPDLNGVKDALVAEYPELRMMQVQGLGIGYLWLKERGVIPHTFEEEGLEFVNKAEIQREEYSDSEL
ncbi:hypothetical protein C8R45DRAFT_1033500 [Mycena sanguinolenta]|nr:hypothetical protein C8R45DRAFT_1033500 [Mycena sanguinolenta]